MEIGRTSVQQGSVLNLLAKSAIVCSRIFGVCETIIAEEISCWKPLGTLKTCVLSASHR